MSLTTRQTTKLIVDLETQLPFTYYYLTYSYVSDS